MEGKLLFVLIYVTYGIVALKMPRNYHILFHSCSFKEHDKNTFIKGDKFAVVNKGETRVLEGAFVLTEDITNEMDCHVQVYDKTKDGDFKRSVISMKKMKCCDLLNKDKLVWPDLKTYLKLDKCPLPKGVYKLENYTVNQDLLPQVMPINQWRVTLDFYSGPDVKSTMLIEAEIERNNFK